MNSKESIIYGWPHKGFLSALEICEFLRKQQKPSDKHVLMLINKPPHSEKNMVQKPNRKLIVCSIKPEIQWVSSQKTPCSQTIVLVAWSRQVQRVPWWIFYKLWRVLANKTAKESAFNLHWVIAHYQCSNHLMIRRAPEVSSNILISTAWRPTNIGITPLEVAKAL